MAINREASAVVVIEAGDVAAAATTVKPRLQGRADGCLEMGFIGLSVPTRIAALKWPTALTGQKSFSRGHVTRNTLRSDRGGQRVDRGRSSDHNKQLLPESRAAREATELMKASRKSPCRRERCEPRERGLGCCSKWLFSRDYWEVTACSAALIGLPKNKHILHLYR